jgi:DNA polymerase-3 subunit delta
MTPEALRAELAKGRLRRAYLVAGAQALLRDEALAALRAAVLGDGPADFNLDRFEGPACTPAALRDAVRTLPVMSAQRLVWLREPESSRAGAKALLDGLPEIVGEIPETAVLVVTAAKLDRRTRWVKAFAEPRALVECEAPVGAVALAAFVTTEARRQGLSLDSGVAELLAERVGPELLVLRQELEKAALVAAPATRIARAHVESGVVSLAEEPVWDLTDAIGEGRSRDALPLLGRLLRAGTPAPVLLGTLASHFRKLLRLRSGGSVAAPPFVQRKLAGQARRYTAARLLAALRAIHDTDLVLKGQGGIAPEIALERLVLGLAA